MFPLNDREPYIKATGSRSTLGELFDGLRTDVDVVKNDVDNINDYLTFEKDIYYLSNENLWQAPISITFTTLIDDNVDIAIGSYTLIADVESNASEGTTNYVVFTYADDTTGNAYITRGTNQKLSLNFAKRVKNIRFYASDTYAHSVDKTATISKIRLIDATKTYIPSNFELKQDKLDISTLKTIAADSADFAAFKAAIAAL